MGISYIVGTALTIAALVFSMPPLTDGKDLTSAPLVKAYPYAVLGDDSLLASNEFSSARSVAVMVTGYSSSEDETDDTPFTTASGTPVRPGVIAANWLPFGTRVRIPELFGNREFVVEDRMHARNDTKLDVWFSTKEEALRFGARKSRVEILSKIST